MPESSPLPEVYSPLFIVKLALSVIQSSPWSPALTGSLALWRESSPTPGVQSSTWRPVFYLKSGDDERNDEGPDPDPDAPGQVVNTARLREGEERLEIWSWKII